SRFRICVLSLCLFSLSSSLNHHLKLQNSPSFAAFFFDNLSTMSKFSRFSLAISYFLLVSTIVRATDVKYCDSNQDYEVKVQGVDISPNPIARGEPATFSISANTEGSFIVLVRSCLVWYLFLIWVSFVLYEDNMISSGKLVIEVSYFGWHIHSETHDLCDETKCPVATGDFLVQHSQVLPGYTPPGSYSLKMKMLDGHKELTCIKFSFDIGFGSSVADI
ncbi:unnamed protein product, partial [Thlaspi arvense]